MPIAGRYGTPKSEPHNPWQHTPKESGLRFPDAELQIDQFVKSVAPETRIMPGMNCIDRKSAQSLQAVLVICQVKVIRIVDQGAICPKKPDDGHSLYMAAMIKQRA